MAELASRLRQLACRRRLWLFLLRCRYRVRRLRDRLRSPRARALRALEDVGISAPSHESIKLALQVGEGCERARAAGERYDHDDDDVRHAFATAALSHVAIPTDLEGLQLLLSVPELLRAPFDPSLLESANALVEMLSVTLVDTIMAPGRAAELVDPPASRHAAE